MSLWKALRDGISAATRMFAPLVVMFVVCLIVALVLTIPVGAAMNGWVGHRLAAYDLARDFDLLRVMEPLVTSVTAQQTEPASGAQAAATLLTVMGGTILAAWLVSSLPNVVLGGGVLLTYADGRFAWRRFLWGAWHWLLPFAALLVIFDLCAALVIALGIGVLSVLEMVHASILTLPTLVLTALVYVALMMTFEYARAIAVADGTQNILRAVGRAVVSIVRQPVRTFGLYLLMAAASLALMPLYAIVLAPVIPFEWGLMAIAAQQFYVAARLWTRLARWASMIALYQQGKGT